MWKRTFVFAWSDQQQQADPVGAKEEQHWITKPALEHSHQQQVHRGKPIERDSIIAKINLKSGGGQKETKKGKSLRNYLKRNYIF